MRGVTIDVTASMVTETCCALGCGVLFAMPAELIQRRRRDHQSFYCPNGHPQSYTAKSEEEKLREKLADTEQRLKWRTERAERLANDNMTLARSKRALRGVVTRLKNKAAAGRCAFCDHEFPDVALHVAEEHPGVVTEATDEDEADA